MTTEEAGGLLLWLVFLYPLWSPLAYRKRARLRKAGARSSTSPARTAARASRQVGPAWEQDEPFPECFEQEDDL